MRTYKVLKKGVFESAEKFEARLNEKASMGWKAISIAADNSQQVVLMEKER
ncbi:MAG: hypothetical protein ACPGRC_01630 [Salibacteraceae bacterium]